MNAQNTANAYKMQQIMTASPEQLTLLLYNGALRFIDESILALERKDFSKSHERNLRAQDIVTEFMATLDMKLEISGTWLSLYDYIRERLVQGNIKKDKEQLREARSLLQELRDTWVEAMKKVRQEKSLSNLQAVVL
ncbi:MAG TPA: flagellar export chaperone FliS [Desulfitobacteriaceae bacterium]|nr:flagellar export chaperone FliS [Desulfitobacteriaceae bacterium]